MHIYIFLPSFFVYKTQRRIRIVSYMYFPHFVNLTYVKRNFIVEVVWKQKTTEFSNWKKLQLVYSIDIKTLGPACKVQTFQHDLSISWSSYSNFFFQVVICLNFCIPKMSGVRFFISTHPFRLTNLSGKFQSLCFTLQLLKWWVH